MGERCRANLKPSFTSFCVIFCCKQLRIHKAFIRIKIEHKSRFAAFRNWFFYIRTIIDFDFSGCFAFYFFVHSFHVCLYVFLDNFNCFNRNDRIACNDSVNIVRFWLQRFSFSIAIPPEKTISRQTAISENDVYHCFICAVCLTMWNKSANLPVISNVVYASVMVIERC